MTGEAEEVQEEGEENYYVEAKSMKKQSDYVAAGNWKEEYGQWFKREISSDIRNPWQQKESPLISSLEGTTN